MTALIDDTDTATEPAPIPLEIAVATLERIAAEQTRALNNACAIDMLTLTPDGNAAGME